MPTMASRMPTERVNTPGGMAAACWFKVIDARGTLTADDWRSAGWIYRALGRP
ncbi:hypothetical protein GCM10010300_80660 [Streptomyces olivaceoviridis]|nr:hypothetical protein GCM10010300_80660 [Streptomyces olivaceoviridis]